jgi:hypothetical protein
VFPHPFVPFRFRGPDELQDVFLNDSLRVRAAPIFCRTIVYLFPTIERVSYTTGWICNRISIRPLLEILCMKFQEGEMYVQVSGFFGRSKCCLPESFFSVFPRVGEERCMQSLSMRKE